MPRTDETLTAIGTQTQRRCAECKRKIKRGHERRHNGKYYGSECIERVLDRDNRGRPDTQERFL